MQIDVVACSMIICVCNNISDSHIREAIAGGVSSMAELQQHLPVSSQCGTCFDSAEEVLTECLRMADQHSGLYYNAA